jgi:hypothetical protein
MSKGGGRVDRESAYPVEYRRAEIKADTRMNKGEGRQMIPGQRVHRSVYNRIAHDQAVLGPTRYVEPAAQVPDGWPSWTEIAEGAVLDDNQWED